jgi:hypothetical protein
MHADFCNVAGKRIAAGCPMQTVAKGACVIFLWIEEQGSACNMFFQ